MKRDNYIISFLLIFMVLFTGCEKHNHESKWEAAQFEIFDINQLNVSDYEVIKQYQELCIQSNEEYMFYFSKASPIDFSKKTLLLGYSSTSYQITKVEQNFLTNGNNQYKYMIFIQTSLAAMMDSAVYGIVIDKVSKENIEYSTSIN